MVRRGHVIVQLPIASRRDLLGSTCLGCDVGVYQETPYQERVGCRNCGHEAERWLTKREMLLVRMGSEGNEPDKDGA